MLRKTGHAMLALVAASGLALAAGTAAAQQTLVVTADPAGKGARAELVDLTPSEAAILTGIDLPPSDDATLLLEEGAPPRWTFEPLRDIHRRMGGKGDPEIVLFRDDDPAGPAAAPQREAARAHGLQPRDGLWSAEIGEPRVEGCPAMIAGMMGQAFSDAELPSGERRLAFSQPFDPNDLEIGDAAGISWQRDPQPGVWRAQLVPEALVGAVPGGRFAVDWRLAVAGEGEIHHESAVAVVLPAEAAAVMGGSGECRVVVSSMWLRVGD